jgi:hypothetical protein
MTPPLRSVEVADGSVVRTRRLTDDSLYLEIEIGAIRVWANIPATHIPFLMFATPTEPSTTSEAA